MVVFVRVLVIFAEEEGWDCDDNCSGRLDGEVLVSAAFSAVGSESFCRSHLPSHARHGTPALRRCANEWDPAAGVGAGVAAMQCTPLFFL